MTKQLIIKTLNEKYGTFIKFINELSLREYTFSNNSKWSAEQQLEHIILCVKPLVHVFGMEKEAIKQSFGQTNKESLSYKNLLNNYLVKLTEGGKAPERFLPEESICISKEKQIESLKILIKELCLKINEFSEKELDSLLVPHPLLKNITLREMLYNATYHVEHHQNQASSNLRNIE